MRPERVWAAKLKAPRLKAGDVEETMVVYAVVVPYAKPSTVVGAPFELRSEALRVAAVVVMPVGDEVAMVGVEDPVVKVWSVLEAVPAALVAKTW